MKSRTEVRFLTLAALTTLILAPGCGSDEPEVSTAQTEADLGVYAVASSVDLPACTSAIEGRLYYLEASSAFRVCRDGDWEEVVIGGGESSAIASSKLCSIVDSGYYFSYQVMTFTTGEVLVNCSIHTSSYTSGNSAYWMSTQNGAAASGCIITEDVDATASGGYWAFETNSGTSTVEYTDSESANHGLVLTFTNCSTTTN